jgi:hypothetical protein
LLKLNLEIVPVSTHCLTINPNQIPAKKMIQNIRIDWDSRPLVKFIPNTQEIAVRGKKIEAKVLRR